MLFAVGMSTAAAYSIIDASDPVDELILDLSMARGLDDIMQVMREQARPLIGADGITFVLRDGMQ